MSHRATHVSEVTEVWQPTEANEADWKAENVGGLVPAEIE